MLLGVKNLTQPLYLSLIVVVFVITVAVASVATRRTQRTKRGLLELAGVIKCSTGRTALAYMMYGCYCGLGGQGWPRDKADWWGAGFNHTPERAKNTTLSTLCSSRTPQMVTDSLTLTTGSTDALYAAKDWVQHACTDSVYSDFPPCRGINSSTVIGPPHFLNELKMLGTVGGKRGCGPN